MAQQERGIRSRQSILEAAAHVFDQRGYDAASTTEILARADLTRGALYHHFPSKEAIASALIEAHGEALAVPYREVRLQAAIDLTLGFAHQLQYDTLLRASVRLAVEQSSFTPSARTPYEQSVAAVSDLLRQAGQQGELLPGTDFQEVAETIVGSFTGLQVMSQVYSDRRDLLARTSALWRLVLPGLAAPGILLRLRTTAPPEVDDAREATSVAGEDPVQHPDPVHGKTVRS
ncbi:MULTISPECIES: ScbR family autoregulator-binding transcription factor [unclassified Streptomyces]|uniref:ScbR family autoregulator-binding transcription factor n=1 Tax=unclassified Streptomyces TaxID=2593676 RepID=UPI001CBE2A41|nr:MULTISPECIES: ScbR family autoregulator-binding transcription factor [unclassified Streptomyces]WPO70815.1 ScbR family autoregulator-binding transcription factor [Streptomyces sp. KN37]